MAKAEALIRNTQRYSSRHRHHRLRLADLRKDLYEAHRLIDGLRDRYPATRDVRGSPQPAQGRRADLCELGSGSSFHQ